MSERLRGSDGCPFVASLIGKKKFIKPEAEAKPGSAEPLRDLEAENQSCPDGQTIAYVK
jgi:hypothetical protein